jgi:plasmid stabilization system protein ParE
VTVSFQGIAELARGVLPRVLQKHHPALAAIVAVEILAKAQFLEQHPSLGYPLAGCAHYRHIVLRVLKAKYVFRYRIDGYRIVMLRVVHGREAR